MASNPKTAALWTVIAMLAGAGLIYFIVNYNNGVRPLPLPPGIQADPLTRRRVLASVHFINSRLEDAKHREEIVRAVEDALECTRLAPDSPIDQLNLAICLLRQYDERRFPEKGEGGMSSAPPTPTDDWIAQAKPTLTKAEEILDRVRAALPSLAAAHFHGAMAAVRRGKLEAADENSNWRQQFKDAAAAYLQLEDRSPAVRYHLAFLQFKEQKYVEAEDSARRAVALDPNHPNAYYTLAQSIARQANPDKKGDMDRAFATHRELQESIGKARAQWDPDAVYDETFPELIPITPAGPATIDGGGVQFIALETGAVAARALSVMRGDATVLPGAISQSGKMENSARGALLTFRTNAAPAFVTVKDNRTISADESADGVDRITPSGLAVGDYDGDHWLDVLAGGPSGIRIFRGSGPAPRDGYTSLTADGIPNIPIADIATADFDSDGDLDIIASTVAGSELLILRNDAIPNPAPEETPAENLTFKPKFTDISKDHPVRNGGERTRIALLDFDGRNDTDIAITGASGGSMIMNRRGWNLETTTALPAGEDIAVGDLDGDGLPEIVIAAQGGIQFIKNNRGVAEPSRIIMNGPLVSPRVVMVDLENRGALDVVVFTKDHVHVLRAAGGTEFTDIGPRLFPGGFAGVPVAVVAADPDNDFDHDLFVSRAGAPGVVYLNRGGEQSPGISLAFRGTKTNRAGIGSRVEARAGSLRVRREVYTLPALIAVGRRRQADGLFIKWTNGIDEAEGSAPTGRFKGYVEKRGREGSCPFLYTFDGTRFVFVTDAIGATPLGLLAFPGMYVPPQDREWLRITENQLKPEEGKYLLRFTEEMRETTYLDRVHLIAVDHPLGTSVYPDEKFCFPPFPPKSLLYVTKEHPIRRATMEGVDVTDILMLEDRRSTHPPRRIGYQGMSDDHALELDLGDITDPRNVRLFLNGWFAWTNSSINRAIAEAGIRFTPPRIELKTPEGWKTIVPDAGFPAGMQKTMCVDLSGKINAGNVVIRVVTNLALYWDRAFLSLDPQVPGQPEIRVITLAPSKADLRWRGVSRFERAQAHAPADPVYEKATIEAVYDLHTGDYTKYGDVLELLTKDDNQFVIFHHGDEVALEFDAENVPAPPPGMTRTFLLDSSGWAKDMDPNTFSPETIEPLPFHGMSGYPYRADESYPATPEFLHYRKTWNTRRVESSRTLPLRVGIEAIHER